MTRYPTHLRRSRPGFTFIEVLFAIIILGIGSIMIAGMLPVAIKQSTDTRNAITGKAACEAGYAYLQAVFSTSPLGKLPDSTQISVTTMAHGSSLGTSTGRMVPLTNEVLANAANIGTVAAPGPLFGLQSITGSRVITSDTRTQWMAFYGRGPNDATAKLVVLALHLNNTEAIQGYVTGPGVSPVVNTLTLADNGPFLVNAEIVDGGALDADKITLTPGDASGMAAAESGAFVIVADSPAPGGNADNGRPFRNNGRVFRLGKFVSGTAATNLIYELEPGYDLPPASIGADGVPNTVDDDVDGSMNTITPTNSTPESSDVGGYRVGIAGSKVPGTAVQVWIVGKGRIDPTSTTASPYVGLAQDVGVLTTQVQLSN